MTINLKNVNKKTQNKKKLRSVKPRRLGHEKRPKRRINKIEENRTIYEAG